MKINVNDILKELENEVKLIENFQRKSTVVDARLITDLFELVKQIKGKLE